MVNENITKLIEAISNSEELQKQLEEAVNQPVERGPGAADDKGLGSTILQALAQSQGLSFGQSDASQLTELLSAAAQQGYGQSSSSGGGLQLLGSQPQQQQPQAAQQNQFFQMGQQPAQNQGTTVYGGSQPQGGTIDMETLNQFMQLFGGAQPVQQQGGGLGGLFNVLGGQSAQPVQQQPSGLGQLFGLGNSGSTQSSSSGLGFGNSGNQGMSNLILQLLMQLMLGR